MMLEEDYELRKSSVFSILHYIFHSGAKAALLPFLTLFFRQIGLSPIETGFICAVKPLVHIAMVPLWTSCIRSIQEDKKLKILLAFSILMQTISSFSFTFVPVIITPPCLHLQTEDSNQVKADVENVFLIWESQTQKPMISDVTVGAPGAQFINNNTEAEEHATAASLIQSNISITPKGPGIRKVSVKPVLNNETKAVATQENPKIGNTRNKRVRRSTSLNNSSSLLDANNGLNSNALSSSDELYELVAEPLTTRIRNLVPVISIFFSVLAGAVMVGSIEKTTDDGNKSFMEVMGIDESKQQVIHQSTCLITTALTAIFVTVVTSYTDCFQIFYFNEYNFNIIVMCVLMAAVLALIPWFPAMTTVKFELVKSGLVLLKDPSFRMVLFSCTVLVQCLTQTSIDIFAFWLVQDLGGLDYISGIAIATASMSELLMLLYGGTFLRLCSVSKAILLSVFCQGIRLLYLSFVTNPWAIVPAELLYMFTNTLLWLSVYSYINQLCNSYAERDVYFLLQSTFGNVGRALGCCLAGVVYQYYGVGAMYRVSALVAFLWLIVYAALLRCCSSHRMIKATVAKECIDSMKEPCDGSNEEVNVSIDENNVKDTSHFFATRKESEILVGGIMKSFQNGATYNAIGNIHLTGCKRKTENTPPQSHSDLDIIPVKDIG